VYDQFMSARSELIKLVNSGRAPLKARAGKLADLQDQLQGARARISLRESVLFILRFKHVSVCTGASCALPLG
jgi:hypothetical protein